MAPTLRLADELGNTLLMLRPEQSSASDPVICSTFDLGFPAVRVVAQDRADTDGTIDLSARHGARQVTMGLKLFDTATTTKVATLGQLGALCHPSQRPYLYINRPEWASERRMQLRADPLSFVSNQQAAAYFEVSLAWTAPSGLMESADLREGQVRPISGAIGGGEIFQLPAGLPAPWTAPLSIPSGTSRSSVAVTNQGQIPAPLQIRVYGRCANPVVTNRTMGTRMKIDNQNVPVNHFLYIDSDLHVAVLDLDPTASIYASIDWSASSWLVLRPGVNDIAFEASDVDENCIVYLNWREGWLS